MSTEFDPYRDWLGIDRSDSLVLDHYQLLGIRKFETDLQLIQKSADDRMTKVRSYQNGPRGAWSQTLLNELAAARACLTDGPTKAAYDAVLQGIAAATVRPAVDRLPATVNGPTHSVPTPPPCPPSPSAGHFPPVTPVTIVIRPVEGRLPRKPSTASVQPRRKRIVLLAVAAAVLLGVVASIVIWNQRNRTTERSKETGRVVEAESEFAEKSQQESVSVVEQEGNGQLHFPATVASLQGEGLELTVRDGKSLITGWTSSEQYLLWKFRVVRPAIFEVTIHYAAKPENAGATMVLAVDEEERMCDVRAAEGDQFQIEKIFMAVRRTGEHTLTVRPGQMKGNAFMELVRIEFVPK